MKYNIYTNTNQPQLLGTITIRDGEVIFSRETLKYLLGDIPQELGLRSGEVENGLAISTVVSVDARSDLYPSALQEYLVSLGFIVLPTVL